MTGRKTKAKAGRVAERRPAAGAAVSRPLGEETKTSGDWRDVILAEVRRLIFAADPEIVEERKWIKPSNPTGVPVWSRAGIVCTGEIYKQVVKLTFARGAALDDPRRLFNASLEGTTRRALDIREGETLDADAFQTLVRAAVAENLRRVAVKAMTSGTAPKSGAQAKRGGSRTTADAARDDGKVVLLSGGNPQIAKADGDAPVQAYIAAMPGWKRDLGTRLDALIERIVPNVRKAVKWNSPFYGVEGQDWFLSFHVFTRYVKVTFFSGAALRPAPPGGTTKSKEARWIDIHEEDTLDEERMATWVKQAAALPGWMS